MNPYKDDFGNDILIGLGGALMVFWIIGGIVNLLYVGFGIVVILIISSWSEKKVQREIEEGAARYEKERIKRSVERSLRRAGIPRTKSNL